MISSCLALKANRHTFNIRPHRAHYEINKLAIRANSLSHLYKSHQVIAWQSSGEDGTKSKRFHGTRCCNFSQAVMVLPCQIKFVITKCLLFRGSASKLIKKCIKTELNIFYAIISVTKHKTGHTQNRCKKTDWSCLVKQNFYVAKIHHGRKVGNVC